MKIRKQNEEKKKRKKNKENVYNISEAIQCKFNQTFPA